MGERMQPIPFENLMRHVLGEYETRGTVFGVGKLYRAGRETALPLFGEKLETPFGPAAGPNTQLAQNIAAAYAAGGRFFELKTVQTLDGEELAKCIGRPCISAFDEGYNCEWSTELTVPQARDEYLKAWWILKLLSREFGLGSPEGFIFNMSVGYDLKGIQSEKSTPLSRRCAVRGAPVSGAVPRVDAGEPVSFPDCGQEYVESVQPELCRSVTLSTLHGCPRRRSSVSPPISSRKSACTPLSSATPPSRLRFCRRTLDNLGYDYIAFGDSTSERSAVRRRRAHVPAATAARRKKRRELRCEAHQYLPVDVTQNELPAKEMYMSGRSLFPLTAELARRLGAEFAGRYASLSPAGPSFTT